MLQATDSGAEAKGAAGGAQQEPEQEEQRPGVKESVLQTSTAQEVLLWRAGARKISTATQLHNLQVAEISCFIEPCIFREGGAGFTKYTVYAKQQQEQQREEARRLGDRKEQEVQRGAESRRQADRKDQEVQRGAESRRQADRKEQGRREQEARTREAATRVAVPHEVQGEYKVYSQHLEENVAGSITGRRMPSRRRDVSLPPGGRRGVEELLGR